MEKITQRERDIWRAAITLANNICIQRSNDLNDDDCSTEQVREAAECGNRIRNWIAPTDEQLAEMFDDAGVVVRRDWHQIVDPIRDSFEQFCDRHSWSITRKNGAYVCQSIQYAWVGWRQAWIEAEDAVLKGGNPPDDEPCAFMALGACTAQPVFSTTPPDDPNVAGWEPLYRRSQRS